MILGSGSVFKTGITIIVRNAEDRPSAGLLPKRGDNSVNILSNNSPGDFSSFSRQQHMESA